MVPAVNLGSNLSWLFIQVSDPWNESDIIECWNFIIFISGDLSISNTSWNLMPLQERYEFLEVQGSCTKKMKGRQGRFLSAAALTYVAASALLSLLRLSFFIWWKR